MNTKTLEKSARKASKRKARKEAPPKGKRPSTEARGSNKKKITHAARGQRKR